MNIVTNIIAAIIVLGFLIFAHEAGHFFIAKLFKVRVLVFSFGFGRRLFGFRRGDTDYRVSLIPLGGYVRMAGDTPDDGSETTSTGAPDEFLSKPKWQKFLILFAGPAMNILIAIAFVAGLSMIGTEYAVMRAVISEVVPNGAAAKAGLQPGDEIVRVGTEPIADFDDLKLSISMNAGTPLRVEYKRGGQLRTTTMTPEKADSDYGPIGRAGITPRLDPTVGRVIEGSPAWKAGIRTGDRVIAVNGQPIVDLNGVSKVLAKAPDAPLKLQLSRGGTTYTADLPGAKFDERNPYRGFYPPSAVRKLSLGQALQESVKQNWKVLRFTANAVARMFRGEGSVKELSGPIDIARISGDMFRQGWVSVIALMAMISLQLGVMNLLPIPVLDGGHIAILLVEGVSRRELSIRAKERIQQVGFAMLAALMIVVLFNDVVKNVSRLAQG